MIEILKETIIIFAIIIGAVITIKLLISTGPDMTNLFLLEVEENKKLRKKIKKLEAK